MGSFAVPTPSTLTTGQSQIIHAFNERTALVNGEIVRLKIDTGEWVKLLGQDLENARLDMLKMMEAQDRLTRQSHVETLKAIEDARLDVGAQIDALRENLWTELWAAAWRWLTSLWGPRG